jgi:hypothetical protein
MAVGWSGADPSVAVETETYELGTAQKANEDITITGVRVWSSAVNLPVAFPNRTATIWSTGGAVLGTADLPTNLSPGWVEFELDTPVERTLNQQWVVSYSTGGNYGFLNQGLAADVISSDTAVTSLGFAGAPSGINGRFNGNPTEFPATGNAQHSFYGVDIVYTLGIGGNTDPEITALDLVDLDGTVTAVVTVTDAETLVGATVRYDWGDFTAGSVSTYPDVTESHTYTTSGIYAILVSVTDTDGATGYRAGAIRVTVPADAMDGLDVGRIMDAFASYAGRIGALERMQLHEPKTAITSGLSAALWFQSIDPIQASGLSKTSLRVEFVFRLYDNMLRPPADTIDPEITRVVNLMFNALHAGFTLGGLISQVDLIGTYGPPLRSLAGYIQQDKTLMRAVSIYIPCIIFNAYAQER